MAARGFLVSGLDGLRGRIERRTRRVTVPQDPPSRERLDIAAVALDDEFREFDVMTCRARGGYALAARRRDGCAPGLYAVVTADPAEMRAALLEDSPPGTEGNVVPGGG